MKKLLISLAVIIVVLGILAYAITHANKMNTASSSAIKIVAAENFYGNIAQQLGGNKVQVLSILSDPNADPHEYESSVKDAEAVTNADIVIKNGDDYDTWMDKL